MIYLYMDDIHFVTAPKDDPRRVVVEQMVFMSGDKEMALDLTGDILYIIILYQNKRMCFC